MTDKNKANQEDPNRPGMTDGETPEAYDERIRQEAEGEGLTPEEYKQKVRLESGTV